MSEFKLGSVQEKWLQQIEGKVTEPKIRLLDIAYSTSGYNRIFSWRYDHLKPWPEIAAAIRADPTNFFTESK